jgi:hypothetical protein
MNVDDYKNEYGDMATTKVMHTCKVCSADFLHTSAIIKKHLQRCHRMSIADYFVVSDSFKYSGRLANFFVVIGGGGDVAVVVYVYCC